jgi:GTP-binding protein
MRVPAKFVISASKPDEMPVATLPEIAVVGRSNVGKSSLLNALVGHDGLARTSRTPGRTRLINWFEVEAKPTFHLVDLPGYGYASVSVAMKDSWRPLIETYLDKRATLAGVLLLIDIRRGVQEEELDFVPWLAERERPIIVALTKSDKLPKNKRTLAVMEAKKVLGLKRDPLAVSTLDPENLEPLWRQVIRLVSPKP